MNLTLRRFVAPLTLGAAGLACGLPAAAADALTDAVQAAYPSYRAALVRTNTKSQAESEQAIAAARRSWQAVVEQHAARPPAPYDRDPALADTLGKVAAVYARAEVQIREQKLPEAHETLEAVRDLLADLRRRNGVVVYSDHVNAYHAQMEHTLLEAPKLPFGPQGPLLLMAEVGKLEYLAARMRSEAPAALAKDAEFGAALQAVEASVAALRSAVLAQDAAASRDALGKLKGPYSRLFVRFG